MTDWLRVGFWQEALAATTHWLIKAVPTIAVILVTAFVLLKLLGLALAELQSFMIKRGQDARTAPEEIQKRAVTLTGVVRRTAKVFVWALVGILVLRELGVDVTPLIAGAGIAGLAVGFGAQNLVRDVISGFFLILENQVRAGDVAVINGTGGLVEAINLRTITLRDQSGAVHIFQNGAINTLANQTMGWSAMVFDIGVAYEEDPDEVMQVMKEVAEGMRADAIFRPRILEPMEIMGVDAFAPNSIVIKARLKTPPGLQWSVAREYRRRLKKAFDARGIDLPFPHVSVDGGTARRPFRVVVEDAAATRAPGAPPPAGGAPR